MCCLNCLNRKLGLLQQAFYVKLTHLKAATMDEQHSHEELTWRYEVWRKQSTKELYRLVRQYNHDAVCNTAELGDISQNDFDVGWTFPISRAELQEGMNDLNERHDRGDSHAELDWFFSDRPDYYEDHDGYHENDENNEDSGDNGDNEDNGDNGDNGDNESDESDDNSDVVTVIAASPERELEAPDEQDQQMTDAF